MRAFFLCLLDDSRYAYVHLLLLFLKCPAFVQLRSVSVVGLAHAKAGFIGEFALGDPGLGYEISGSE